MALQSSGQIKLSEIAAEFGGSAPHALSEYYGDGNAPASGEIQLAADFYGTSNEVIIHSSTISPGSISPKSGLVDEGYDDSAFSGNSFGSISTTAITGTSVYIRAVIDRDNTSGSSFFNITLSANFTGWTTIRINNSIDLNRSNATTHTGSGYAYRWSAANVNSYPTPTSFKIIQ